MDAEDSSVSVDAVANGDASPFGDLVRYADAEDATAKAIVKRPVAAYVEKVYEEGNFAALGIGT